MIFGDFSRWGIFHRALLLRVNLSHLLDREGFKLFLEEAIMVFPDHVLSQQLQQIDLHFMRQFNKLGEEGQQISCFRGVVHCDFNRCLLLVVRPNHGVNPVEDIFTLQWKYF